ncbi:MAG TPA: hypothetical protein VK465_11845 [Fibrobacteria bacterium]|nr:hypothetical protein [Fibrobacteria bacterium]
MGRFLLPAAAFLFLFTGLAGAGRPANGYFYYSFNSDVNGHNIGKVEWNWDGRGSFWLGTPLTYPGVAVAYGLVHSWDSTLIVAGRHKGELYRVKPGDMAHEIQKNTWDNPEHIYVDPSLKSAWVTDNRGALHQLPLDPFGKAVAARVTGTENGINTIAFKDADVAWYTRRTQSRTTHIGELDPKAMTTRRRLTIPSLVNDSHYDPFTHHVLFCGDKTIWQYDPVVNAIISQREFKHVTELYSCVIDGEGRVILSSWDGDVFFIDYSGTGRVGDSTNFSDTTRLVEGMYFISPLIGPGSPPRINRPIYTAARGAYRDADGDGRIDGAMLEYKTAVLDSPGLARLADPADPAKSMVFDSTQIRRLDPTHFLIDFRDRPLPFGTSVRPGTAARILQDTVLFGNVDLPMADEVGPQVIAAESRPPRNQGDKPTLTVTFSEGVGMPLLSKRFPFLIKRPGADVNGKIQVESIRDLGKRRYEYVLASEDFPLLGDSLKLVPGDTAVRDSAGNLNNMSVWIGVGGDPLSAFFIQPEKNACVVSYRTVAPLPPAPAIFMVQPAPGGSLCLNCGVNAMATGLVNQTTMTDMLEFHPWLMTVKIQGPVRYSLKFFTSLGIFVNSAIGEVTPDMLRRMQPGPDGLYTIRLYWWPVAQDGRQAATGAYVMRGVLSEADPVNPRPLPSSTEAPSPPRRSEKISATFGFLRRG